MGTLLHGYREGPRTPVLMPVSADTTAITVGDLVAEDADDDGHIVQLSAGEMPVGVAMQASAVPSADGDISILVDVSTESLYRYPPDAGTVTQALVNKTMDTGGPQSCNIDATADDSLICRSVDIPNNTLVVSLNTQVVRYLAIAT